MEALPCALRTSPFAFPLGELSDPGSAGC